MTINDVNTRRDILKEETGPRGGRDERWGGREKGDVRRARAYDRVIFQHCNSKKEREREKLKRQRHGPCRIGLVVFL